MPDPTNPYGDDQSAWDPSLRDQPPARPNQTAPWQTGPPVAPEDQTMVAPVGWSPPGGPPPPPPAYVPGPPAAYAPGGPPAYSPSGPAAYSPGGPPPYYPGSPPPPPNWGPGGPGPQRGIPAWVAVSGIVVALLVVIGLAVTAVKVLGKDSDDTKAAPTSETSTTPPPTVSVADLQDLLPSIGKVESLLQISGLEVADTWSDTYVLRPEDHISDSGCIGVQYVSEGSVYSGSSITAMRGERLKKKGNIVDTTVSSFPSSGDAAAFVEKSTQTWRNCARKPLSRYFSGSDESESWLIGAPEVGDNKVSILNYEEGGEGWACSHAMGNATNVVVETLVCGIGLTDEAGTLLDDMLSAIAA